MRLLGLSLETNIEKVQEQSKCMLKEAQRLYGQIISKMNKLFEDIQSETESKCQSRILLLTQHQEKINAMIAKLDSSMTDIEEFQGKSIGTKLILKIQENFSDINQITGEFRSLNQSLPFLDLSFIPNKTIQELLSTSYALEGTYTARYKHNGRRYFASV